MESKAETLMGLARHALYNDDEIGSDHTPPTGAVVVDGIVNKYAFHPERIAEIEPALRQFIRDVVPDEFMKGSGGGHTFLNLCVAKDGEHWAEHPTLGMLVALAIGCGVGGYCLPREFWGALPGSVPYVWFDPSEVGDDGGPVL